MTDTHRDCVRAQPRHTGSEYADIAAAGLLLPGRQVIAELCDGIREDTSRGEIPLHFDQAIADLKIGVDDVLL
jgi:hypothetical protein